MKISLFENVINTNWLYPSKSTYYWQINTSNHLKTHYKNYLTNNTYFWTTISQMTPFMHRKYYPTIYTPKYMISSCSKNPQFMSINEKYSKLSLKFGMWGKGWGPTWYLPWNRILSCKEVQSQLWNGFYRWSLFLDRCFLLYTFLWTWVMHIILIQLFIVYL